MIFAFKNAGVEMTVDELYSIVANDKFDEFFDFLTDLEEEASYSFMDENSFSPNETIELTEEQKETLLAGLVKNGDLDGDMQGKSVIELSEEELFNLLFGDNDIPDAGFKSEQSVEWTTEDEKLKRFIRRLK